MDVTLIAAALFCIVSLVTFGDLAQVQYDSLAGNLGSQLNGVMAATFVVPVVTCALILMSFFVLVKKSVSRSGPGFSYGFTAAFFLLDSMLLMLTGIELTANKHFTGTFEQSFTWPSSATSAYIATYVLAFISCVFTFITGVALISNRRSFGSGQLTVDELGLTDRLRHPGSPSSSAVGAGMAPSPASPPGYPASASGAAYSSSMPGGRGGTGAPGMPHTSSMPGRAAGAWNM